MNDKKGMMGRSVVKDWPWLRNPRSSVLIQVLVAVLILVSIFLVLYSFNHHKSHDGLLSDYEALPSTTTTTTTSPSVRARLGLSMSRSDTVPKTSTRQSDVFISVKTSGKFHQTRLALILNTWFTLAKAETWFFSDQQDPDISSKTNGHLINTGCSSSHNRQALCCKMGAELDAFLSSGKRWFCHFDDDNYVNIRALVKKLRSFNHTQDWYLGKPSISEPLEILDQDNTENKLQFWFATGGAGFCLSQSLAQKMSPYAGEGRFEVIGEKNRLPDDVTVGYIAEHLLRTPLTVIEEFHSHLEAQKFIGEAKKVQLEDQISFSYSKYGDEMNVINLPGQFSKDEDPTRFKSLHCKLFPNNCSRILKQKSL